MGGDDLSLTTLVAPVPVPDEEPPPKPEKQPEQKQPEIAVGPGRQPESTELEEQQFAVAQGLQWHQERPERLQPEEEQGFQPLGKGGRRQEGLRQWEGHQPREEPC